jgi:AcrR family transcriptional regulator
VSIRAVADAVGVTAPTIYRHFEDKDGLINEVCHRAFAELHHRMEDEIGDEPDPVERLHLLGKAYLEFGLSKGGHYRVLFMDKPASGHEPTSWDELLADTNGFGLLIDECRRAVEAGVDAASAEILALNLWSTVHGILALRITMPSLPWPPVEQQLDQLDRQLRAGRRTG